MYKIKYKLEINYASPPRGYAIPAGHVQKRLSLNLVSLRDGFVTQEAKNVPMIFLNFFLNFAEVFVPGN